MLAWKRSESIVFGVDSVVILQCLTTHKIDLTPIVSESMPVLLQRFEFVLPKMPTMTVLVFCRRDAIILLTNHRIYCFYSFVLQLLDQKRLRRRKTFRTGRRSTAARTKSRRSSTNDDDHPASTGARTTSNWRRKTRKSPSFKTHSQHWSKFE